MLRVSKPKYLLDLLQQLLSPSTGECRSWSHRRLLQSMQAEQRIKLCTNHFKKSASTFCRIRLLKGQIRSCMKWVHVHVDYMYMGTHFTSPRKSSHKWKHYKLNALQSLSLPVLFRSKQSWNLWYVRNHRSCFQRKRKHFRIVRPMQTFKGNCITNRWEK